MTSKNELASTKHRVTVEWEEGTWTTIVQLKDSQPASDILDAGLDRFWRLHPGAEVLSESSEQV